MSVRLTTSHDTKQNAELQAEGYYSMHITILRSYHTTDSLFLIASPNSEHLTYITSNNFTYLDSIVSLGDDSTALIISSTVVVSSSTA